MKNTDADLPIGSLSLISGRRPGGTLPRKGGNLYERESRSQNVALSKCYVINILQLKLMVILCTRSGLGSFFVNNHISYVMM